ncbi:hypothetical protein EV356DRAFT_447267 [Viridothelium virens]|uniref:DUF1365-domain-containing protein n=1 Tax=Viridothelium virens TaxID=1048519 RepID=A0A6A6H7J2_VIRVR|nr:hypothetical protein EV356DRAFT_447267 [Viridothelium virens]
MLLPCRTTHTRLFPKKHSFSYSYLLVGIPVGWRGLIGNALSVDTQILPPEHRRSGWFHISGADYLDRDGTDLDLKAKLASYLQSQGENPGDFPHVYLVTAPKFLGYSFNPVSFWYLYSELRHLKAMILEVNNTFDERRMYFLKPTDGPDSTIKHGSNDATELLAMDHESLPNLGNANSQPAVFSNAWSKDFHVSPFNDRTGSYSLIAYDPLSRHEHSKWLVDNTVVLKSAENHPKLVARIFADGDPVDPQARGRLDIYPFLIRWWWVGFVTFPRILKEAWILYFKRSLPVWFRPEIDKNSIGRTPTGTERLLATYFERYLEHLVKHANQPLCLVYQPPSGMGLRRSFKTTERHTDTHLSNIELHVLTPAFYSRFVHYSHTSEAFDRECLCTDELNRTLWISRPELLPALFKKGKQAGSDLVHHLPKNENVLERLRWAMLKRLRCSPTGPGYPDRQEHTHSVSKQDIRSRPYSELDWHVRKHQEDSSRYRHKTTALFLAQRFAFGFEGVISALDLLLRFALILCPWLYKSIILNPTIWLFPNWHTQRYLEAAALELLLTNLVHIWALLK